MDLILEELLRRLIWGAVGVGVERLLEGTRAPALTSGDVAAVASLRSGFGGGVPTAHGRACACSACDDRFILGLDDEDD